MSQRMFRRRVLPLLSPLVPISRGLRVTKNPRRGCGSDGEAVDHFGGTHELRPPAN
jgi:hypothetical protein